MKKHRKMMANKEPQPDQISEKDVLTANIAKALGHPARIWIVRILLDKESCIGCDFVDEIGLAQSTVSEHLRILKAAGIITGETEHPRICYSLNPVNLLPLSDMLNAILEKDRRGMLGKPICSTSSKVKTRKSSKSTGAIT